MIWMLEVENEENNICRVAFFGNRVIYFKKRITSKGKELYYPVKEHDFSKSLEELKKFLKEKGYKILDCDFA